jgi:integrase
MKVALRDRKLPSGKKTMYLDIYHKGKRRLEYLGIYLDSNREKNKERKRLAEKIRTKREVELQNNSFGFVPESSKQKNFTAYLDSIASEKTKNSPTHNAAKLVREFSGSILTFQQVDEKWLNDFKKFLLKKVSQNSAATYFQKVKQALKQAKMERIIDRDPGELVRGVKFVDTERVFLELNEVEKLAKTECREAEVKRAFLFSCFTGLRFSDIKRLSWKDIKEDKLQLKQQKTKSVIYIPLTATAQELLKKNVQIIDIDTKLVFNLPQKWWTNQILKEWAKEAGIKKNISYHTSRHTFATMSLTYGNDIYVTSSLLAHKNVKTTQVYAKIVDEKKQKAVDSFPKILIS